jgi:hypothetical protein
MNANLQNANSTKLSAGKSKLGANSNTNASLSASKGSTGATVSANSTGQANLQ